MEFSTEVNLSSITTVIIALVTAIYFIGRLISKIDSINDRLDDSIKNTHQQINQSMINSNARFAEMDNKFWALQNSKKDKK